MVTNTPLLFQYKHTHGIVFGNYLRLQPSQPPGSKVKGPSFFTRTIRECRDFLFLFLLVKLPETPKVTKFFVNIQVQELFAVVPTSKTCIVEAILDLKLSS